MGSQVPDPGIREAAAHHHRAQATDPGGYRAWALERAGGISQRQDPGDHAHGLWVPLIEAADRSGDAAALRDETPTARPVDPHKRQETP